jgi:uncharacterized protein (DUF433 family)
MPTELASLITNSSSLKQGRPRIAGTGLTVHRIALWYKLGHSPEEVARRYGHISEAQVYAALAYYHANREQIEVELAADSAEAERLEAASSSATPA